MIEAADLSRRFDDNVAVDRLSFEVGRGEIVGLLGANGAGKTTTMRMILGLLAPTAGTVVVDGLPVSETDRRSLGYVPQSLGLYRDLTVAENLAFVAAAFGVPVPSLNGVGMGHIADQRVGDLPLGMRRRVAFMAALSHQPTVLVLDEPTSGVGPLGRARLWESIHSAADEGAAVLVSTHHMEEAEECDRVVVMASGKEVLSGRVSDIVGSVSSVSVVGAVADDDLEAIRAMGGTVLIDGRGWRVVGLDVSNVRRALGSRAVASEVPATFEEVFVSLSR
ncbi:MAG TPA: ABC transporter ATP-binding protein [Acidimicrobiia bacterium]